MDTKVLSGYNKGLEGCGNIVIRGNPDFQGVDITQNGNVLAGVWYDYDDNGPRWYTFSCAVTDKQFDILGARGGKYNGTFANPSTYEEHPVGIGSLDLEDGVFRWNTKEHGIGSYVLRRNYALSTDPRSGLYYDPNRSGEGFGVKYWGSAGNILSMYWYGWRTTPHNMWWLCSGTPERMDIYEYIAEHMYKGGSETKVGLAKFDGSSFEYIFTAGARAGTNGKIKLTRLM